ncbi:hypothetical protein ACFFGR_21260 [Arthrobacter liuii]|uniref:TetR family transcriptional regulator n=1 Tax=Arthrobacter liuii TaxID=1476996 RepID=A0ABQ2AVE0_9MICC|nr:hypothetical protein [Arthrobacter liuii]GGH98457.1 hypothetical protein GCM10007170_31040 [Arthrobacter liuii]
MASVLLPAAYLEARHEEWLGLYRKRLAAVRRHKEGVQELLAEHLTALLPGEEERTRGIAAHLAFLLEGAMARAGLEGNDAPLQEARLIATGLLDAL